MGSLSSMGTAVSALMANRAGLNTTAHNLTNVNTKGYVRQQQLMNDANYSVVGHSGTSYMSIGLGTDVDVIRQVRDIFLDKSFRVESGRNNFYAAAANAMEEVETILGEIQGETYNEVINDFWVSLNELSKHPEGLETRAAFVQSASKFTRRSNLIMENLREYQKNIDTDIRKKVKRINEIGQEITKLNVKISKNEVSGAHANDYRDTRNILLDELGGLIKINYRELADGTVTVTAENTQFVLRDSYYKMTTINSDERGNLIQPYWPHLKQNVFDEKADVSKNSTNDIGGLKGLVIVRGNRRTNYTDMKDETSFKDIKHSAMMVAMATFDKFVHGVATLVNDRLAPTQEMDIDLPADPPTHPAPYTKTVRVLADDAPFGLNGTQGTELFKRKYIKEGRFKTVTDTGGNDHIVLIEEDKNDGNTLYNAGNLEINPEILEDYSKIPLSKQKGFDGDSSITQKIINAWNGFDMEGDPDPSVKMPLKPGLSTRLNIRDFYTAFVGDIGAKGRLAGDEVKNQTLMTKQIDNQRDQLMGVSSDEELGNMLKYQHAYNAASRLISILDSMIDKVVNNLGVVGR